MQWNQFDCTVATSFFWPVCREHNENQTAGLDVATCARVRMASVNWQLLTWTTVWDFLLA